MTDETLAEVLAAHHWGDDTAQFGHCAMQCGCGWKSYEPSADIYALRARHDRHRAEALAARIVQARAGDEDAKDRKFGNLRWMDGHQQGLKDGLADARHQSGEGALRERIEAVAERVAATERDYPENRTIERRSVVALLRAALDTAEGA